MANFHTLAIHTFIWLHWSKFTEPGMPERPENQNMPPGLEVSKIAKMFS